MAIKSKIKGKKKKRNYPTSKKSTKYKIVDGKIVREKYCPRCGPGIFLMVADNRDYCGRCHYTEFKVKSPNK
jgi:small subunit ribosomal protein S27Ae